MVTICSLKNIEKKYGDNVILNNFNLSIKQGELIAVTGKSGSGKSTLLNIIGLLEQADKGVVHLFGEDDPYTYKSSNKILRTKISYLFQNYALIDNQTVGENLAIALVYSGKSKQERVQIKKKILKEVGLDLPLDQKVYSLSGGEQQRVAIARIMLKPSELILADEPTGSLDVNNRDIVIHLLRQLNDKGKAILIVTHDENVANMCDKVINLDV